MARPRDLLGPMILAGAASAVPVGSSAQLPGRPFGTGPSSAPACGTADLVGKKVATVDLDARVRALGLKQVRVVRARDAITMDMLPSRLTVVLDDTGTIVRTYCG